MKERHQIRHTSFCSSSLLSKLSLYDGKFIQTKSWNCTNDLPADFVSLSQVVGITVIVSSLYSSNILSLSIRPTEITFIILIVFYSCSHWTLLRARLLSLLSLIKNKNPYKINILQLNCFSWTIVLDLGETEVYRPRPKHVKEFVWFYGV